MRTAGRLPCARSARGFTLLELMIAVVLVAVLTAIALPSYQEHVRKAKRTEAKSALLKAAQLQERAYTSNNATYVDDLAPLFGLAAKATVRSGEDPSLGNYVLSFEATDTDAGKRIHAFTLTATPNPDKATGGGFTDPDCGNLTLTSTGVRGFTGTGPKERCW